MIIAAPTNDGATLTILYWTRAEFNEFKADVEGNFLKTFDLVPELADRIRAGTRIERIRGTGDLPNFFRRPHGPGWALVGDAGYHKDPILAQGISDAFRDAELLADAVHDGFAGRRPLSDALADYERTRNELAGPGYEMTCQLATLEPPDAQMQQLFGALINNQGETNRFFGMFAGTVPIPEFLSPENVGRIMSHSNEGGVPAAT
jgi:flavin-dependent dehydrogenase